MQITTSKTGSAVSTGTCWVNWDGSIVWGQYPGSIYTDSSSFTRDKKSGPRPKPPFVKLTPMTKLTAFQDVKPISSATAWYGTRKIVISGDWARLLSSTTNDTINLDYWRSWIAQNPGVSLQKLESRLLISAHNKALEPDFDTPVFLAELKETLSMLRHPLRDLLKFMRKRKSIKSIASFSAGQWLQYRYGIRPLLSDLDNGLKTVVRAKHRYARVLRKASAFDVIQSSSNKAYSKQPNNYVIIVLQENITDVYSVNCSRYYNWNETVYKPLLNFNIDLATLGGVIWELIPYSFVADWFVNAGDWIASHRDNPRIDHRGYTTTISRTHTRKYSATYVRSSSRYYPKLYPITDENFYSFGFVSEYRTVPNHLPAWPVTNWEYRDILHVVDGLTLTFQQLLGKRR